MGHAARTHNKDLDSFVDLKFIRLKLLTTVGDEEYKVECTLRSLTSHVVEMA